MTREGPSTEVRGAPGDLKVELAETPTSGYRWEVERAVPGVEVMGDDYLESPGELVAGGSGLRTFRLHATAAGSYELAFVLRRPWESEPLERRHIRLVVGPDDA
jgi:predicted secreted protein